MIIFVDRKKENEMKTTKKAMSNIEEVSNQFAMFCQYIETHKDGEVIRNSDA